MIFFTRFFITALLLSLLPTTSVFANSTSAKTLPKGVFRAQVTGIASGTLTDEFNNQGQTQSIAAKLNRSVTAEEFAKFNPQLEQLVSALNALSPQLADDLMLTNLFSDIEFQQKRIYGVLSYGLRKNWTVSGVIPVYQRSINVTLDATSTNNANFVNNEIGQLSPDINQGLDELAAQTLDGEFFKDKIFREKGYKFDEKQNATDIGDIELKSRYRYSRKKKVAHSVDMTTYFPTGKAKAIDNVFDPGSGKGFWRFAVEHRSEWSLGRRRNHRVGIRGGIELALASQKLRAIPKDADDDLPSLLPEDGQVQLSSEKPAPLMFLSVGSSHSFANRSIIIESDLTYENQGQSSFKGPGDLFYEGLEQDSGFSELAGELALGYSHVKKYLRKRKGAPFEVFLRYNRTLAGQQTEVKNYIRTDLVLFFK